MPGPSSRYVCVIRSCAVLLAAGALFAQSGVRTGRSWAGWEEYQVILWSTGNPYSPADWLDRIREAGFTGEPCAAGSDCRRFADAHLGFYVENMISELAFLHSRAPLYQADLAGYTSTHDRRYLVRKPCFDDPAFWETVSPRLIEFAKAQTKNRPLAFDLRDEPSIGSFTSPMDYCFCPHTLRAFRGWLQKQYSSLGALNLEWETKFAAWDDVTPLTTFETKERERQALSAGRPENYAPWADHRAFMDASFSTALDRMRGLIHDAAPGTPVGIAGAQMASAWGGYDLWRISQAVDWIEPYDLGNSRLIFRSFLPPHAPVLATFFGNDVRAQQLQAWRRLLDGDRGAIIWDDDESRVIQKPAPAMPLTDRGRGLRAVFEEVRRVAPQWFRLRPVSDRIAIHYSQASIRAHWMFDSREDGNTWIKRLASYEEKNSRVAKSRNSFVTLIQDLGFQPEFVSYAQLESGDLIRKGYKALLLPQSVAMSIAECRNIDAFVRAGGAVIADNMAATMDEHGRRREKGCLDDLFGVRQKPEWKPKGDGASIAGKLVKFDSRLSVLPDNHSPFANAPMVQERRTGRGAAFFLNIDMHAYGSLRGSPNDSAAYRELFAKLLQRTAIAPAVGISGAQQVATFRYTDGQAEYIALIRNQDAGTPPGPPTEGIEVVFPAEVKLTDLLRNRDLGVHRKLQLELEASRPALLKVLPVPR